MTAARLDDDEVAILADLIQEDAGLSPDRAMGWAKEYSRIRGLISEGRALVAAFDTTDGMHLRLAGHEKYWIDSTLLFRGIPTIVRGAMGFGKTYLNSWTALRAAILHPDWDILTNVPWFWNQDERLDSLRMPNFFAVNSMSEMLRCIAESVLSHRVPAVIIDEMDHAISSQGWKSDENISWQHFTYIERHLDVRGPLLTYHSWNDIPYYMRKGGIVNAILKVRIHEGRRHVFGRRTKPFCLVVTGAAIPYSTHGAMGFKIDVEMGKLHSKLNATNKMEIAKQILDNLSACVLSDSEMQEEGNETASSSNVGGFSQVGRTGRRQRGGVPVRCWDCGYEWRYKGKQKKTLCGHCHAVVVIADAAITENNQEV
ncbi:MAG: hypothetical protein KIY12_07960 [Thermoplasmata archaeon]|uniref:Uncharacterized protein n=1 Tax=Candidatus Sysuiplasma superficiale TaxID=2823368 RepID=A0A8J8CEI2_9ARCH|nr:hypothetical protein [Candidatus Sysuiplasma superficiale]